MYRIESLLSARTFTHPQLVGDRLVFISNLSGHMSLYAMNVGGSVPEPLLPPHLALVNPVLLEGSSLFYVFPKLGKILVMLDHDGDEQYRPMLIPIDGGYPEPAFPGRFDDARCTIALADAEANIVYIGSELNTQALIQCHQCNLETGETRLLSEGPYGPWAAAHSPDHRRVLMLQGYTTGDHQLFLWQTDQPELRLLYGQTLEMRQPGQDVPINAVANPHFTPSGRAVLLTSAVFDDRYSPGLLPLAGGEILPVDVDGLAHTGNGELERLEHLHDDRYLLEYNIDGATWAYEAAFDEASRRLSVRRVVVGERPPLTNGMATSLSYEAASDRFALSYTSAVSPTQIYTIDDPQRQVVRRHTNERLLGLADGLLSPGEDASYTSYDGTPISARLYLPAEQLGFSGPRPVVFYIHGGPQGQERPDFAWFSMPIIQFLTLNGVAVFVPNVRGSTGYGLRYMKQVDRDWGGRDRLDHVHALTQVLAHDPRLDTSRAGVMGRSYGGYMTLTLLGRHPELWAAGVDMFGPFDLLSFSARIPETWKPYFVQALGDPVQDKDFLVERSPRTYLDDLACPMLVIQGKNDPRVAEAESSDLVQHLRSVGKDIDYLLFDNEGHDVLKFENRVRAYNAITDFFKEKLKP